MRWQNISSRWLYLVGALTVSGLMGFGFYLQYFLHEEPCPLCMVQRVIFILIMIFFLLAAMHGPRKVGRIIYAIVLSVFSLLGVAVAGRHIWLQNLPADEVPACGPGLEYMLETLPMSDVLQKVMYGSGECAEKGWTFLSLGIPEWSLLCYLALGAWAVVIAVKRAPESLA